MYYMIIFNWKNVYQFPDPSSNQCIYFQPRLELYVLLNFPTDISRSIFLVRANRWSSFLLWLAAILSEVWSSQIKLFWIKISRSIFCILLRERITKKLLFSKIRFTFWLIQKIFIIKLMYFLSFHGGDEILRTGNLSSGIFSAKKRFSLGSLMCEKDFSISSMKSCSKFSRVIGDPMRIPSSAILKISLWFESFIVDKM